MTLDSLSFAYSANRSSFLFPTPDIQTLDWTYPTRVPQRLYLIQSPGHRPWILSTIMSIFIAVSCTHQNSRCFLHSTHSLFMACFINVSVRLCHVLHPSYCILFVCVSLLLCLMMICSDSISYLLCTQHTRTQIRLCHISFL